METPPMEPDDAFDAFADLAYAARGRLFSTRPGAHRSRTDGTGGGVRGLVSLLDQPDPRRIDIRASIRDPQGTIWVRRHEQTVDARVCALVDLSGSMGLVGRSSRPDLVRTLCGGLARAVERSGDRFALVLAGGTVHDEALLPPARRRGLSAEAAALAAAVPPHGHGAAGLIEAVDLLPTARSIILLISDFTFPAEELDALLGRLAPHDVRPILLRDSAIEAPDPRFGLLELHDLEEQRRRLVLMRPSLAERWRRAADEQRRLIRAIFADHGLAPIEILDQIDLDALFDALGGLGDGP